MKGVVVFKSRYGATAEYANWLGTILQLPVYESEELSNSKLNEFDYVIAGTSVYVGNMLLRKWIKARENILSRKKLFLFVVCGTPSSETAELKGLLERNISPGLLKTTKVFFLKGRMIKSKLSFIDGIVLRIGAAMQKRKSDKKRMLTDYNDVRQENLRDILNAVRSESLVYS